MKRLLRNEEMNDPRFWAMHYYMLIDSEEVNAEERVEPYFGFSSAAVNEYFVRNFHVGETGLDETRSYLEVSIRHGFSVQVERGDDDRVYINHEKWPQPVCLGHEGGCFAQPAFRWSEAAAMSEASTGIDSPRALLLIFPSVWLTQDDNKEKVYSRLIAAWKKLGFAQPGTLEEMVGQIIERQTIDVGWSRNQQLGWINDGRYSFRNPQTLMTKFDESRFEKVATFFDGIAHTS